MLSDHPSTAPSFLDTSKVHLSLGGTLVLALRRTQSPHRPGFLPLRQSLLVLALLFEAKALRQDASGCMPFELTQKVYVHQLVHFSVLIRSNVLYIMLIR